MTRKLVLLLFLLGYMLTNAQNPGYETGARSAAMGGASVSHVDIWSIHQNQGSMAFLEHSAVGLNYGRRFNLRELSQVALAGIWHTDVGNFGISAYRNGFDLYNRTKIGLAYARTFGENIGFGVQFNVMDTYIDEIDNQPPGFTFEMGFRYKINDEFSFAAHYFNPTRARIHPDFEDRYSTILRAGFEFQPVESFALAGEAYKDMNQEIAFRMGMDYALVEMIFIRVGFATGTQQFGGGLGIHLESIDIDLTAQLHRTLGWSPQIGLNYRFDE